MSKYLQIQIPEPCHENWNEMIRGDEGRYCSSCQKNVIDFTLMSDDDLVNFFTKSKENVCGRFVPQQLDKDILISSRKIPWVKYFFQVAIPAFLFSSKGIAQGNIKVVQKHVVDKKRVQSQIIPESVSCNMNLNTISNAKSLDEEELLQPNRFVLGGAIGGVIIIQRKYTSIPLLSRLSRNNSFTIFPNPIISNSRLTIKWKKGITTDQTVQIYNQSGILLQNEMIRVKGNTIQDDLHLNQLAPGNYVIRITDNKTKKFSSQQFIIL